VKSERETDTEESTGQRDRVGEQKAKQGDGRDVDVCMYSHTHKFVYIYKNMCIDM